MITAVKNESLINIAKNKHKKCLSVSNCICACLNVRVNFQFKFV